LRKIITCILALLLLVISACNLPAKSGPGIPAPTRTADPVRPETPAIIATQAQPTLILPTPGAQANPTTAAALEFDPNRFVAYSVQPGDTLTVVAAHFGVAPGEIRSAGPLPAQGLLPNRLALVIPKPPDPAPYPGFLLPDSEIVNSPCGSSFENQKYVKNGGGWLGAYTQIVDSQTLTGPEVVKLVAENTSVNPRLLLALIEFRSHWVLGSPAAPDLVHPLGLNIPKTEGLFAELTIYAQLINLGYYGWRLGKLSSLPFADGSSARIAPELNPGTVAVQYLFARSFSQPAWEDQLYGANGFFATYQHMFGDPLACDRTLGPLFPDGLQQPTLDLPFAPGEPWALTGGLHEDWNTGTPLGALDFAPITGEPPCTVSRGWVLAAAPGTVTRSENGALQLALVDEAGNPTGWELLYMHVAAKDRLGVGMQVKTDDPLGHPSCEGGAATGTHVHLARLYRGEWIGAGDPLPYLLGGWLAVPGNLPYQSSLVKGQQVITANINGTSGSQITR
jgi:LasA protease